MRMAAFMMALVACGCSGADHDESVERVELQLAGLTVSISRDGSGRFNSMQPSGRDQTGAFQLEADRFKDVLQSLSGFRRQSVPSEQAVERFAATPCPKNLPYVTDRGALSVRWIGPALDNLYVVDRGCDYRRRANSDRQLQTLIMNLPVPRPALLP